MLQVSEQTPMIYTVDEAAFLLSVSTSSIRRWIRNGSLKTVRLGTGVVRIELDELVDFISKSRIGGTRV